jgi:hypothetical protein
MNVIRACSSEPEFAPTRVQADALVLSCLANFRVIGKPEVMLPSGLLE